MLSVREIAEFISKLGEPVLQTKLVKAFQILAEIKDEIKKHQRIVNLIQHSLETSLDDLMRKRLKSMKTDFDFTKVDKLIKLADDKIRRWQETLLSQDN